ncbi:IPT/TIG domain-containing protein [bacterium]|nr:IPT/TIG domain-containing protein [bacterium]
MLGRFVALVVVLALSACVRPPMTAPLPGSDSALAGRVEFGGTAERATQATVDEIAKASTVSLIDLGTSTTITSGVTDANGSFTLNPNFRPNANALYALEAVKGLFDNKAGKRAARVRTLLGYQNGWTSLTGAQILINPSSTALSMIVDLRSQSSDPVASGSIPVWGSSLIGTLDPRTRLSLTPGVPEAPISFAGSAALSGVHQDEYRQVHGIVIRQLALNADPVAGALINTRRNASAPWYSYAAAVEGFSITDVMPASGAVGDVVTLFGNQFNLDPSQNHVYFNGVRGTVRAVLSDQTQMQVEIPAGATSGPVTVEIAGFKGVGPSFHVTSNDGHSILDAAGNLYVAGNNGVVFKMAPDGTMASFATGFTAPSALTLDRQENLYVTDSAAGSVTKVTPAGVKSPLATGLSQPSGIALGPDGLLYISCQGSGKVVSLKTDGTGLSDRVTALSGPAGLGFDPRSGDLLIANNWNGSISRVASGSASGFTYAVGFNAPWGLAVNTAGDVFVANQRGSSIVKVAASNGTTSTYANRYANPKGVALDKNGRLHVSTGNNGLYRIDPNGSETLLASGFGNPWGLAFDAAQNLFGVSTDHEFLSVVPKGATVAQRRLGVSTPTDMASDAAGNLYIASQGNTLYKYASNGALSFYPLPDAANGVAVGTDNNLYVSGNNTQAIYKLDANGSVQGAIAHNPIYYPSGMIGDGAGNIYYLNESINPTVKGTLVKWDGSRFTTLATGIQDAFGLVQDAAGDLYVTAAGGGQVYKYTQATKTLSVIASGLNQPRGITIASESLFVATRDKVVNLSMAGAMLDSNYLTVTGGPKLMGMTADASNNLYLVDGYNTRVYKITGKGVRSNYGTGLTEPVSLAFGAGGVLLVGCEQKVMKVANGGGGATNFATNASGAYGVYQDQASGKTYAVQHWNNDLIDLSDAYNPKVYNWGRPQGMWGDAAGRLWVVGGSHLFQLDPSDGGLTYYSAWIDEPKDVVGDNAGNLYVTSEVDGQVQQLMVGNYTNLIDLCVKYTLNKPCGLVMVPGENALYVGERGSHSIKRFDLGPKTASATSFWPYSPTF